jgi:hypothetical protein
MQFRCMFWEIISNIAYLLHLISFSKYLVTLICILGNSSRPYFMIVSLFLCLGLLSDLIIPFIEKILFYVLDIWKKVLTELFLKKFVISSIIRCLKISILTRRGDSKFSSGSRFSFKVLFHKMFA